MFSTLIRFNNKNFILNGRNNTLFNPQFKKYILDSHFNSINNKLIEYRNDKYNNIIVECINNSIYRNINIELPILLTFYTAWGIYFFYYYIKNK